MLQGYTLEQEGKTKMVELDGLGKHETFQQSVSVSKFGTTLVFQLIYLN